MSLGMRQVPRLAVRDFVHEAVMSACIVLGLAAVLTPLLVLFGLKFGIIDTMATRLLQDPHNRELILVGAGQYDAGWMDRLRRMPGVAYAIPETRRLSASFNLVENTANGDQARGVAMIPAANGEPLLAPGQHPASDHEAVLSQQTARRLGVRGGETVRGVIQRMNGSEVETVTIQLLVRTIVSEAALPGDAAFVTLDLLQAVEDYRDGFAVPRLDWPGQQRPEAPRVYPRFRLYAASIYDITSLQAALQADGVEVRSRAVEVEAMQALDRNMGRVYWTIATLAAAGFIASLAANMVSGVERKRRDLSVLRLLGFSGQAITLFPIIQALLIAVFGSGIALGAFHLVGLGLNHGFADDLQPGEAICRLLVSHQLAAAAMTVACAQVAAAWAGFRVARIRPAEGLRDV